MEYALLGPWMVRRGGGGGGPMSHDVFRKNKYVTCLCR